MRFFGYLDPGTGSMFVQAIIGIIAGGAFVFRTYISKAIIKVRSTLGKNKLEVADEE